MFLQVAFFEGPSFSFPFCLGKFRLGYNEVILRIKQLSEMDKLQLEEDKQNLINENRQMKQQMDQLPIQLKNQRNKMDKTMTRMQRMQSECQRLEEEVKNYKAQAAKNLDLNYRDLANSYRTQLQ